MLKKPYQNKGPLGKHSDPEQEAKPVTGSYSFKQDISKM